MSRSKLPVELPKLFTDFLSMLMVNEGLSANTIAAYQKDLQIYQAWWLSEQKNFDFKQASRAQLEDFLFYLQQQGRKENSNARLLSTLKRFYQWGSSMDYLQADPTALLKAPKLPKSIPMVMSEQQVEDLINAPDISTA